MKRVLNILMMVLLMCVDALCTTVTSTTKIIGPDGQPFNGTLTLQLPFAGVNSQTNQLVLATPVSVQVFNGLISQPFVIPGNDIMSPKMPYSVLYADSFGAPVTRQLYYITGTTFDVGSAPATPNFLNTNVFNTNYITPQVFGAKCDGITDDAPAFRAALATGMNIRVPACPNSYVMKSFDPSLDAGRMWMMVGRSDNYSIIFEQGAKLFVPAGGLTTPNPAVNGMGGIFATTNHNNIFISGFYVDMNGTNNRVIPQCAPGAGLSCVMIAINMNGGSDSIIENSIIINSPGRNAITVGGQAIGLTPERYTIRNNFVHNGGTNIVGNTNQNDWSAIYIEANHSTIENNKVINDVFPQTAVAAGGIEVHGSQLQVRGNIIDHAVPGMYVGSDVAGQNLTDVTIAHNIITNSTECLSIAPISFTDDIVRLKYDNNTCTILKSPNSSSPWGIIANVPGNATYNVRGVLIDSDITNNTFFGVNGGSEQSRGIVLAGTNGVRINNNTFSNLGHSAITLFPNPFSSSLVDIRHNTFRDWNLAAVGAVDCINADLSNFPLTWVLNTTYALHQFVKPITPNGFSFEATTPGISAGVEPTWPVVLGNTVTDGTVVWTARAPFTLSNLTVDNNTFIMTVNTVGNDALRVTQLANADILTNVEFKANTLTNMNTTAPISGTAGAPATVFVDYQGPDGTISLPTFAWHNEQNSGWYRGASGDFRFSRQGVDQLRILSLQWILNQGGSYAFGSAGIASPDTGLSRIGAAIVGVGTNSAGNVSGEIRSARISATYNAAGTVQTAVHLVQDTCTLGTSCTVTLTGSAAYTNSTSYTCTCQDETAIGACKVAQTSGSALTITGTGTDVIRYSCTGN